VPHVDAFLEDLRAAADEVRALPPPHAGLAALAQAAAAIDPATLDEAVLAQLLAGAGMGGVGVPEESASINQILNALPRPLTEALLTHFVNQLFA
jgi:sphinganine-1-phosphate aldolase